MCEKCKKAERKNELRKFCAYQDAISEIEGVLHGLQKELEASEYEFDQVFYLGCEDRGKKKPKPPSERDEK